MWARGKCRRQRGQSSAGRPTRASDAGAAHKLDGAPRMMSRMPLEMRKVAPSMMFCVPCS
eukprot:scaffold14695_cov117-Isochrysis_galbana.AAC.2